MQELLSSYTYLEMPQSQKDCHDSKDNNFLMMLFCHIVTHCTVGDSCTLLNIYFVWNEVELERKANLLIYYYVFFKQKQMSLHCQGN